MITHSKYRNKPTEVDGIRFASKREARRYSELMLLAKSGAITSVELQPSYPLIVNEVTVGRYVADFRYYDNERGLGIVEDAKGMRTPVYQLKKKLMRAIYGIEVQEV